MRIIELSDMLREIEHERACVVSAYSNAPAYRDAVLEGLRLAEVIARDSATAENVEAKTHRTTRKARH